MVSYTVSREAQFATEIPRMGLEDVLMSVQASVIRMRKAHPIPLEALDHEFHVRVLVAVVGAVGITISIKERKRGRKREREGERERES
jgi:hypothetical protein